MLVDVKRTVCNGSVFKWLMAAGTAWLEHNQQTVNQLNVFPVPDGDTGTNMLLTMRKAYGEVINLDEQHVGKMSSAVARGALMGARGNSGVILSQLLRGFAAELENYEMFDSELFAQALQNAVKSAYAAVIEPVEGTILTVAREAAEAVIAAAPREPDLVRLLETMLEAAKTSLKRTPDLLPILKKAGVVDSGGQGFVFIVEGMVRLLRGEPVNIAASNGVLTDTEHWQDALVPEDEAGYGYDVQFLMHGENMNVDEIRAKIDAMGWSTLVVGDSRLIKVHVHVHDPGQPLSYAISTGAELDDLVVENMQRQYHKYVEKRVEHEQETAAHVQVEGVAVITVASGDGLHRLFVKDLGAAHVISGGQTMNPSTEDFIAAIRKLPNEEIILLPNNKNIIMAAQQAASMTTDRRVRVVPSRTIQQGIAAMFAYANMHDSTFDELESEMADALNSIVSCDVTHATRDAEIDGVSVRAGQIIGLLNGKLVASGENYADVIRNLLVSGKAASHELITLYYGDQITDAEAHYLVETLTPEFPALELEVVSGGQPLYPYLISIE